MEIKRAIEMLLFKRDNILQHLLYLTKFLFYFFFFFLNFYIQLYKLFEKRILSTKKEQNIMRNIIALLWFTVGSYNFINM